MVGALNIPLEVRVAKKDPRYYVFESTQPRQSRGFDTTFWALFSFTTLRTLCRATQTAAPHEIAANRGTFPERNQFQINMASTSCAS